MKRSSLSALVVVLVLALLTPANAGDVGAPSEHPAPQRVVVTGDRGDPSGPCRRPGRVGELYMRFNQALNAADPERLRTFWREKRKHLRNDRGPHARGTFRWFSISGSPSPGHKDHFVAFNPAKALRYVKERREFRMQLTQVRQGLYGGQWVLDDGRTFQVVGKAAFSCRHEPPLFKVWSMRVRDVGEELEWDLCPDPAGGVPPGTLISCAAGPE